VSCFLIDTNVISELIKATPAPKVAARVDATDEQLFHLSALTLGEVRRGIVLLPGTNAVRVSSRG
jgi:predicted nucleic acid-binding protein